MESKSGGNVIANTGKLKVQCFRGNDYILN